MGAERPSPTCGALKTRGGCRASIAHAWSPKNGGWVQSVHRPRVEPSHGREDEWTRQPPHFFLFFFLKINHATSQKLYRSYYPHRSRELVSPVCGIFFDKSRNLSKIVSVLLSASVERFNVSRMRDFYIMFTPCHQTCVTCHVSPVFFL